MSSAPTLFSLALFTLIVVVVVELSQVIDILGGL